VVELKGSRMTRVSAECALASRLGNQHLLHLASPTRYGFGAALCAAQPSLRRNAYVPGPAVLSALRFCFSLPCLTQVGERRSAICPSSLESVPFEPTPHCRIADSQVLRNPLNRQAIVHERLKLVSSQATPWAVMLGPVGSKAVLLHPIADGRRMSTNQLADRIE